MITAAISSSVMILVILVLRLFLLKRLPKRCFRLLWILAALRILIPFSFTFEVEIEAEKPADIPQTVYIDTSDAIYSSDEAEIEAADFDFTVIIKSVLLIGTIISAGFLISAYARMRKIARHADTLAIKYAKCMRGVQIRTGNGASTPFSCGVFRPIIFIPSQMLTLDATRLELIIAHEQRHIKNGDQLVKWLIAAALCLNWYNPLVWVMWQLANRDIEIACDEAVVSGGTSNYDYALCLIAAEEARMTSAVCSFGAPVLNERIELIMKSKKLTVCSFIGAGLILTMMTVFFINVTAVEVESKAGKETEFYADTTIAEPDGTEDVFADIEVTADEQSSIDTEAEQTPVEIEISEQPDTPIYEDGDICADYFENFYPETPLEELYEVTTVEDIYIDDVECEIGEVVPQYSQPISNFGFSCPLREYGDITGHFGSHTNPLGVVTFNNGVNVSAALGSDVFAAADGKVTNCGYSVSVGNFIEIDHGDGWVTLYHHLEKALVSIGDEVERGEKIGAVGSTGEVTGPNLGFALTKYGAYLDPEPLFTK